MTSAGPALGYGDYLRFSRLVHELFGLSFPEKRRTDLEQGVRQAFAASTCSDLDGYYHLLLDSDHGAVHRQRLVNALTIGESHFFRDAGQFDALYRNVLPEIIERRRALRTLRIWSAGCAGGEEPYSVAILLRELLPDVDDWSITILGTDINTEALDRARRGTYSDWAFREARAKGLRGRYFQRVGKRYVLAPEVTRMVSFTQLNLAEDNYPSFQTNTTFMDLILCRNVTIYFAPSLTRRVIERLYEALVDEGWLLVGHSEHSLSTYSKFQARSYPNTILYQRTGQPAVLPEDWDWLTPAPEAVGAPSLRVPPPMEDPEDAPSVKAEAAPAIEELADPCEQAQELLAYGHSEQARDVLLAFVERQPDHVEACTLLCQAYANLGHWNTAERYCQHAISLDNLSQEPYYTLALVLQHQDRLDEAVKAMKKFVYLDNTSVRGHYGLANLYYSQAKLPQALKSLDNARRLLREYTDDELIGGTGGITVGDLRQAITQQQQQWNAEAMHRL
jgi:chemotaxis protein methyltransferase CheR